MNETEDDEQFEQLKAWLSQRSEDRKVINRIDEEFLRADRRSKRVLLILLSISLACILYAVSAWAHAAGTVTDSTSVQLQRSGVTLNATTTPALDCPAPKTAGECDACMDKMIAAELARRSSGYVTYRCLQVSQSFVQFKPNRAPKITGMPTMSAQAGQTYAFTPASSDPDGDTLAFSIANKPSWASFNTSTGRLSGTPVDADVGRYANITISVSDGNLSASLAAFDVGVQPRPNQAPTISGTPASTATVGQVYTFTPTASDPDGDVLVFSLENRPPWAWFDVVTGTLSGTPKSTDVGVRSEIRIRVSDSRGGEAVLQFPKLTTVAAAGSATLSWTPPTENTDGTALTDLAGYRIVYGTSASALSQMIEVPNPSVSSYVVEQLSPATWYFAVRAYTTSGEESANSNVASKTLP